MLVRTFLGCGSGNQEDHKEKRGNGMFPENASFDGHCLNSFHEMSASFQNYYYYFIIREIQL